MPPSEPSPSRGDAENSVFPHQYEYLRQLLLERSGMVLESGREYFVELRLAALANANGFGTIARLFEALGLEERWGVLHRAAVEALAINETSFFRDLHPFEEMRRTILPQLIAKRRTARELNIWCASVASGQEPYSLAMLIKEHFPELAGWKVRLLATDFSTAMLRRCREGVYTQIEVNRGLPIPYLVKYFTKSGSEWHIRKDLREMVEFRELNLVQPWPVLPTLDLVLMRNVLLYFMPETRRQVLSHLARRMHSDGWVFLGGAESTLVLDDAFEHVSAGRTIVHRPRRASAGRSERAA